jgi:hypothetical protein
MRFAAFDFAPDAVELLRVRPWHAGKRANGARNQAGFARSNARSFKQTAARSACATSRRMTSPQRSFPSLRLSLLDVSRSAQARNADFASLLFVLSAVTPSLHAGCLKRVFDVRVPCLKGRAHFYAHLAVPSGAQAWRHSVHS